MTRCTAVTIAGSALALAGITAGAHAVPDSGLARVPMASSATPFRVPDAGPWARGAGGPFVTGRAGDHLPGTVLLAAYTRSGGERAPRSIARAMLRHRFHWKGWQFKYLNRLWSLESGWNRHALNPYSGAYGIPQAVPASKMASAGRGWRSSARTQILWGLRYIKARYRTPYWAWVHERSYGWY